jgi:hypothetical protein
MRSLQGCYDITAAQVALYFIQTELLGLNGMAAEADRWRYLYCMFYFYFTLDPLLIKSQLSSWYNLQF